MFTDDTTFEVSDKNYIDLVINLTINRASNWPLQISTKPLCLRSDRRSYLSDSLYEMF